MWWPSPANPVPTHHVLRVEMIWRSPSLPWSAVSPGPHSAMINGVSHKPIFFFPPPRNLTPMKYNHPLCKQEQTLLSLLCWVPLRVIVFFLRELDPNVSGFTWAPVSLQTDTLILFFLLGTGKLSDSPVSQDVQRHCRDWNLIAQIQGRPP